MGNVRPTAIDEEIAEMAQRMYESGEQELTEEICQVVRRPKGATSGQDHVFHVKLTLEMEEEEWNGEWKRWKTISNITQP